VKKWEISDSEIARSLTRDADDRFVAQWLSAQKLDSASEELLELGREIYRTFFKEFKDLPTANTKSNIGTPAGGKSRNAWSKPGLKAGGWRKLKKSKTDWPKDL